MRKREVVKIDGREITVKELRVKDIIEIAKESEGKDGESLFDVAEKHLPKFTDLSMDDIMDMAPSELKQLYDTFKEVNAVFFEVALSLGAGNVIEELKKSLRTEFSAVLADSFKQGMETPLITDTPAS